MKKQRWWDRLPGKKYRNLYLLCIVALLMACALQVGIGGEGRWMHYFMGILLSLFGLLKLFQPTLFAQGWKQYDLVAQKWGFYAYLYPYLELGLGLCYLAFVAPYAVYLCSLLLAVIGTLGVVMALKRGLRINCPCMGSVLEAPLSVVTIIENVGMGVMALWMLFGLRV